MIILANFNSDSIDFIMKFIEIVVSSAGVLITYKIYKNGIERKKNKLLKKLGVEIAFGFALPLMGLIEAIQRFNKKMGYDNIDVELLCNELKMSELNSVFPTWETKKSDIWEAFSPGGKFKNRHLEEKIKSSEPYKKIENFIKKANSVEVGIKTISDSMVVFLKKENIKEKKIKNYLDYLKDDYSAGSIVSPDDVRRGISSLNQIANDIKNLPDELVIKEYCISVEGKYEFPEISI